MEAPKEVSSASDVVRDGSNVSDGVDQCPICLLDVSTEEYRCACCGKLTHWVCVSDWWRHGAGCPVCRHCVVARALRLCVPDLPDSVLFSLTTHERRALLHITLALITFVHSRHSEPDDIQDSDQAEA